MPKNILETILTIIFYIINSISSFNLFKLTMLWCERLKMHFFVGNSKTCDAHGELLS